MDPQLDTPVLVSNTLSIAPSRIFNYNLVRLRYDPKTGDYDFDFSNNFYYFESRKEPHLDTQSWIITDAEDRTTYWLSSDITPVLKEVISKHFSFKPHKIGVLVLENIPFPLDFLDNDVIVGRFHSGGDFKKSPIPKNPHHFLKADASDEETEYLTSGELVDTTWKVTGARKLTEIYSEHLKYFEHFDELNAPMLSPIIKKIQKETAVDGVKWRFSASSLLSTFDLETVLRHVAYEFRHCATWKYVETMKSRGKKKALNIQLNKALELNILMDCPVRMDDLPRIVLQIQDKGTASPYPSFLPKHHHFVSWLRPHFLKLTEHLERTHPNTPPRKTKAVLNWALSYLDWLLFNIIFYPLAVTLGYWMSWEYCDNHSVVTFMCLFHMAFGIGAPIWFVLLKDRNTYV